MNGLKSLNRENILVEIFPFEEIKGLHTQKKHIFINYIIIKEKTSLRHFLFLELSSRENMPTIFSESIQAVFFIQGLLRNNFLSCNGFPSTALLNI